MYCRYCGENNLDEAVFCKNCGKKLKEEPKKVEVVERPQENQNNYQKSTTTTAASTDDSSAWVGCCCLGLIIVFLLSALSSGF